MTTDDVIDRDTRPDRDEPAHRDHGDEPEAQRTGSARTASARGSESRRARSGRARSGGAGVDRVRTSKGRVRGARTAIATVVAVVALIAAGVVAYVSPLMSVRTVTVTGAATVDDQQIRVAAGIRPGTPLLQVDTRPAAERIARIVRVKSVRVTRSYPSAIAVSIVERVPVVFVMRSGAPHLFDVDGVDLGVPTAADLPLRSASGRAAVLPALPRLVEPAAGMDQASRRSALEVAARLPDPVRGQVIEVAANTPADVRLTLRDKRVVVWGDAERTDEKARTLRYLLTRPATQYDVTSPMFPTYR
ncbi:FtsQ-type POTRA domain-containing protein [Williamsia sp. CHRR-6]|uniref:cell division protein FtsQ/DivIB n=1 Tax=Williamsia sp. CHRR-6 TaxID=2835871 RepID=UPI001BD93F13|nr:FtsQ-type POTRA domain-containing protein [Williamsia sp. CHRR-6]MBT0565259.1 FtsQ-type POTRA domain-containing protein [Williamsia sp. CHRR-6]